jgi:cytochrome P450
MEPAIRRTANELVDRFIHDGRADLQQQLSTPLPLLTIMRILGLPDHDAEMVRVWSIDYNNERSPSLTVEQRLKYLHGVAALRFYLASHVEERRARPREDTITHLVQAEVDGDQLSTWEIVSILHQLVFAGHETTIGLIGCMMYHLLKNRDYWEAVKANPELRPQAVEEALRREGSVNGMFRTALEDVEIHGVKIPKGSRIQLMFASGSHDEEYFEDPLRYDLYRKSPKDHLAFGVGRHYCIGAPLARTVARIALDTLCERIPTLRLAPDAEEKIQFLPSALFRARISMPVEWDLA